MYSLVSSISLFLASNWKKYSVQKLDQVLNDFGQKKTLNHEHSLHHHLLGKLYILHGLFVVLAPINLGDKTMLLNVVIGIGIMNLDYKQH